MTAKINPAIAKLAVPVGRLHEDPQNARKHDERNIAAIAASLQEFGQQKPVVALKNGTVIAGNGTLRAAMRLGWDRLAVAFFDSKDIAKAKAFAIADNRSGEVGSEWDAPVLAETLKELEASGFDVAGTLNFSNVEIGDLLAEWEHDNPVQIEDGEIPEPPANPVTKPGTLWILGDNRLYCGDSSKKDDVAKLLAGNRIHLVNTDPPYNVKVEPRSGNAIRAGLSSFKDWHSGRAHKGLKNHQHFDVARGAVGKSTGRMRAKDRPLVNDFLPEAEFEKLLRAWFGNIAKSLIPGRSFYIWGGYGNCGNYPPALKESGLYFSQAIIWVKEHPVMTRKDFMGNHEWCFYGWREGAAHWFAPDVHNATDVWAVKKVAPQKMVHLTEKPVELAARAMTYSSRGGENVLDLFGGSGSTLIAAEQMGRKAFLMELDPAYCDVIVGRWERLTGKKAREEGGESARMRRKR